MLTHNVQLTSSPDHEQLGFPIPQIQRSLPPAERNRETMGERTIQKLRHFVMLRGASVSQGRRPFAAIRMRRLLPEPLHPLWQGVRRRHRQIPPRGHIRHLLRPLLRNLLRHQHGEPPRQGRHRQRMTPIRHQALLPVPLPHFSLPLLPSADSLFLILFIRLRERPRRGEAVILHTLYFSIWQRQNQPLPTLANRQLSRTPCRRRPIR